MSRNASIHDLYHGVRLAYAVDVWSRRVANRTHLDRSTVIEWPLIYIEIRIEVDYYAIYSISQKADYNIVHRSLRCGVLSYSSFADVRRTQSTESRRSIKVALVRSH